jgi:probable rRNA maturation factor
MPDGPGYARTVARASARTALAVSVVDGRGRPLPAAGLAAWLRRVAPGRARGEVSIALVSNRRIRALNRAYRRKDYATDVLSFPGHSHLQSRVPGRARSRVLGRARSRVPGRARSGVPSHSNPQSPLPDPFLGDIVIGRGVARRQARQARHSEQTELRVLALHGLLHLLGYDHERDNGRMLRVELRLRRKGGLREGLIERARPSTHREPHARPEDTRGMPGSGRAGRSGHARGDRVEPPAAR